MTRISVRDGDVEIDADAVARALAITPEALREGMRAGTITSRVERGEGEDAGRTRLTFFTASRRARFTCDATGAVIATDAIDFEDRPLPDSLRRGG